MSSLFTQPRPDALSSDEAFFHAFAQLASAICTVHNFTIERLDLTFIGCHHDLKPDNILFSGDTFVLSDFGLSRFQDAAESSKEQFKIGQGHYLAPECEDAENGFKKGIIGRSSDIWSFGCIIADVLTYLLRGPGSVTTFKMARKVKIGALWTYTFYGGQWKENPGVTTWLNELKLLGTKPHRMGIDLVRRMLELDPEKRPKAGCITFELSCIAFTAYVDALHALFARLSNLSDSVEAEMERRRFRIWAGVFESTQMALNSPYRTTSDPMVLLEPILRRLSDCKGEISAILEHCATARSPLYSALRHLIDQLYEVLPSEHLKMANSQFETELVESTDVDILGDMYEQYTVHPVAKRVCMLLTIKRMSILAFHQTRRIRPDLFIESSSDVRVDEEQVLGEHNLADIDDGDGTTRRVVVEWIYYSPAWEGPVSEEMMARVEAIAVLLNNPVGPINHVLHCSGYYHQPSRPAFGVVYEFPASPLPLKPRTLASIIHETMEARNRPPLEDKFSLACELTKSLIDCHKVGWMHERISAHNVVFFHAPGASPTTWIQNAFIVGFNHSREDDPKAFTMGPDMSHYKTYHHPAYAQGARFEPSFDFYSLGLVLLEIGLWRPMQQLISGWKYNTLWKLRDMLLEKRVPLLAHAMGRGYRDLVELCLKGIDHEDQGMRMGTEVGKRLADVSFNKVRGLV